MSSLEFTWTFPYRPLDRRELEPVIPLRLYLPRHTADLIALVDTGAERTLLDGAYLRASDIDIFSGSPLAFQGFLGAGMTAYVHQARLRVGEVELDLPIAFSAQPLTRQVLGRDALYHLRLGLRERALKVHLGPED